MTLVTDVKQCPLCGGKHNLHLGQRGFYSYYVHCNSCGIVGPLCDLQSIAIERWNNLWRKPQFNWTTKLPAEDGTYLVHRPSDGTYHITKLTSNESDTYASLPNGGPVKLDVFCGGEHLLWCLVDEPKQKEDVLPEVTCCPICAQKPQLTWDGHLFTLKCEGAHHSIYSSPWKAKVNVIEDWNKLVGTRVPESKQLEK